jgi:hypothetical protein
MDGTAHGLKSSFKPLVPISKSLWKKKKTFEVTRFSKQYEFLPF